MERQNSENPPVTPSILDCCIIRVDYSLAVYIHIPGAKKLMLELPLVIGTIPYNGFGSRNSSVASQFSMDMSWLTLTLPEQPEAPPNYADVVSEEEFSRHIPPTLSLRAVWEERATPCLPAYKNSGFSLRLFIQRLTHTLVMSKRPSLSPSFSECVSVITVLIIRSECWFVPPAPLGWVERFPYRHTWTLRQKAIENKEHGNFLVGQQDVCTT